MVTLLAGLLKLIVAAVKWVGDLWVAIFVAAYEMLLDVPTWVFDQLLGVAVSAVASIQVAPFEGLGGWGSVPSELVNILQILGVPEATVIILAAIGIRFVLQLIPFVRLGS